MSKNYKPYEKHVFICTSGKTCPSKLNTEDLQVRMKDIVRQYNLQDKIRINKAGCLGWCGEGPIAVVYPKSEWHTELDLFKAETIVNKLIQEFDKDI